MSRTTKNRFERPRVRATDKAVTADIWMGTLEFRCRSGRTLLGLFVCSHVDGCHFGTFSKPWRIVWPRTSHHCGIKRGRSTNHEYQISCLPKGRSAFDVGSLSSVFHLAILKLALSTPSSPFATSLFSREDGIRPHRPGEIISTQKSALTARDAHLQTVRSKASTHRL